MRHVVLLFSSFAVGTFTGCGAGEANPSPLAETSNLHGGILIPLPEDQGFVELLNDRYEKKRAAYLTTIVAYVLQPDKKTAFPKPPTSVSVTLLTSKGKKTIPLLLTPRPSDPVGSVRFVSDLGPYELNQIGGDIAVEVDGKRLTATFRGPR
jgi:hypothetical protein